MRSGTVKWYNPEKGYGFILPDDKGDDVFLPACVFEESPLNFLERGQRVQFESEPRPRGPCATLIAAA